ncbi:hypothetical protein [Phytohabitans rumicis]|uniref:Uncharacterized protein n=1 Tax=Phytohabitans rumicis TaxID=1076125 RepID=A0A6V8LF01_9ACTN|nr:hypothetical protein [Phytohabitans rumicis]GFJ93189.1 hypothetical protein Prum_068310 [Phytohabitans rumicis]
MTNEPDQGPGSGLHRMLAGVSFLAAVLALAAGVATGNALVVAAGLVLAVVGLYELDLGPQEPGACRPPST